MVGCYEWNKWKRKKKRKINKINSDCMPEHISSTAQCFQRKAGIVRILNGRLRKIHRKIKELIFVFLTAHTIGEYWCTDLAFEQFKKSTKNLKVDQFYILTLTKTKISIKNLVVHVMNKGDIYLLSNHEMTIHSSN